MMKRILTYGLLSLGLALKAQPVPDSSWAQLGLAFARDSLFPERATAFAERYKLEPTAENRALRDAYYRVEAARGAWYYQRNRYGEAVQELLPILEDSLPNAEKSFALSMLSLVYLHLGEPQKGLALLATYRAQIERQVGKQGVLRYVEAECLKGKARLRGEALDTAAVVGLLQEALQDSNLSRQVRSYAHLFYLQYGGSLSRQHRDSLLAENRKLGVASLQKGLHYHHSMAAWHERRGAYDSAAYHYERFREMIRDQQTPDFFSVSHLSDYARLRLSMGDSAAALRLYLERDTLVREAERLLRPQRNALLINRMEAYRHELEKQSLEHRYQARINMYLGGLLLLSLILLLAAGLLLLHRKKQVQLLKRSVELEEELTAVRRELQETARSVLLENPNRQAFGDIMQLLSEALAERNLTKMEQLRERLHKVSRKQTVDLLYLQDEDYLRRVKQQHPQLSDGDIRLISLLRQGMSVKELAQALSLSYKGAETAKYRLKKKLGLKNRADWDQFLHNVKPLPE